MDNRLLRLSDVIAASLSKLPNIAYCSADPKEQLAPEEFPAIAVFPGRGTAGLYTQKGADYPSMLVSSIIVVDIHCYRRSLNLGPAVRQAREILMPALGILIKRFSDDKFDGLVDFLGDPRMNPMTPIIYDYINLGWGTAETIGYRIRMTVAMEEELVP